MAGGVAQVAGVVPIICDDVPQEYASMELSLFSRDVIAMAIGFHTICLMPRCIFGFVIKSYLV
ncbi:dihydroxyacid dehydratase/phosphogluconate dehydratase [Bartonella japonica]|uniref:Dihydroxyacid dehydratase/phosphogluconate dehydratase n=1 Tax=Bartonella japonica TaxID=357761 RepID=A0ABV2FP26_9HYPH